jgi:hypothetical protein
VEHGGKLFERINANEPAACDKRYRNNNLQAFHGDSEFLPTPREPSGQGVFRIAGWVLLLLFLPTKKSKRKKCRLIRYGVPSLMKIWMGFKKD